MTLRLLLASSDLAGPEIQITGAATATIGRWHRCSGTVADYTLMLPPLAGNAGKQVGIVMAAGLTKLVTVDGDAADLIDGAATRIMWAREVAILRVSDDESQWVKIAGKTIPMVGHIANNATQSVTTATATDVTLAANGANANCSAMLDAANSRLVIKRPGKYVLAGNAKFQNWATTASTMEVMFSTNGTTEGIASSNTTVGDYPSRMAPMCMKTMAVGDLVKMRVRHYSGVNQTIQNEGANNWLMATEVPEW